MKFLLRFAALAAVILSASAAIAAPRVLNTCTTITDSGAYVVGRNITAAGDCFVIATDYVNLDFDGFVVTGNGTGAGVTQTMVSVTVGRTGIVIRNGVLTNFGAGVSLDWSTGARVENMTIANNAGVGLQLGYSSIAVGNTVTGNSASGIVFAARGLAQGNNVSGNNLGIDAGLGANITGNNVGQNRASGILAGEGALISNNIARSNALSGIVVDCPSLVIGNTSSNNGTNLTAVGGSCDPTSVLCCVNSINNMTMN